MSCFAVKLFSSLTGQSLPVYLDSTVVGMFMNCLVMVIVSLCTKVTEEEVEIRNKLFIVPESEKNPRDIRITKTHMKMTILLGIVIGCILVFVWGLPFVRFSV